MIEFANILFTVTAQVALKSLPSVVVAVIVVFPAEIAVTRPFWSTVATLGLLDVQDTVLLPVSAGYTVAVNWDV